MKWFIPRPDTYIGSIEIRNKTIFGVTIKMIRRITIFVLAVIFAVSAVAHHSTTHFSPDVSEMRGVLVDLHWRNPHVYFFLETVEENGETKTWEMEAGTIYMIGRAGVTRDLFTVGDTIRVAGNKSEVYDDKFWVENILTAEGIEVAVTAGNEPYFTNALIGGRNQWTNEAFVQNGSASEGNGIYRVWSPPNAEFSTRLTGDPENNINDIATAASLEAGSSFDPYSFDAACELPGMPRVNHGPHPHQFVEDGDNILFVAEEFYITRTIHMNSDVDPETVPHSSLGFSKGHWQDENTLIVETTRINYPYMNLGGIGQSENVRMYEKYVLAAEENRLDFEVIITDPGMITEPLVERGVWLDIGETVDETYDCIPKELASE